MVFRQLTDELPVQTIGKTPSFGGLGFNQLGTMFGAPTSIGQGNVFQNQLKNFGIGPQGKDRACSSQSGYIDNSSWRQRPSGLEVNKNLLNLINGLIRAKTDSRKSSPDIHK